MKLYEFLCMLTIIVLLMIARENKERIINIENTLKLNNIVIVKEVE